MRHRKTKKPTPTRHVRTPKTAPFAEHLYELRRRAAYVLLAIVTGSTAAYFVQQQLVDWLLAPSHNQQFIYTSPGGGIGFLFQVCTYAGIILSLPIIVIQALSFMAPVMGDATRRLILRYAGWSVVLAAAGLCFGYFIGLPAALHFLGNQFVNKQVRPLFTIQEYMSFVTIYLLGSALLFQLPLLIVIVNGIHPLPPRGLLKAERYVIAAAFIISMLMVPTINIVNQLIIALPIIAMYQVALLLVWRHHRKHRRPAWLLELLEKDQQLQLERVERARTLKPV